MTARGSRGEGGLHWDETRQHWIATATLGFDGRGKRITKKASGTTKTAAKDKLKRILRDHEDGLTSRTPRHTVGEAVNYWLDYALSGRGLCEIPTGKTGRPSKSLTFAQAEKLLTAAEGSPLRAYIVLSLLVGARTEELRALRWADVNLDGKPDVVPPIPPSISVLRSVRLGGDTKTRKSRRRIAMPLRCVDALRRHKIGRTVDPDGLVFATANGTGMDAHNVRRTFRRVVEAAGLDPKAWTPRELRHSFVSLLSESGSRWSRSPGSSGTAGPRSPRPSIGSSSSRPSTRARPRWTTCSRWPLVTQIVTRGTTTPKTRKTRNSVRADQSGWS
jgi:site-specific recombinase XerD